ncbi:hypothetical protein AVEN_125992-1 [Araneus ventricosus]|uniref:Uncharacterized protein n=1 Tax=Araneus ventricosus TaxID=182803 RepID=A0A4Y2PU23_ARAVE|nr:hypothetical protein AVEN_125992-1 [Araneus ventricosus]
MCPKKCVTPHSGSVADRTNLSRSQQATHLQEKVKGRRRVLPHPARPHRVQRTDLPYFCGGVRNTYVPFFSTLSRFLVLCPVVPKHSLWTPKCPVFRKRATHDNNFKQEGAKNKRIRR